MMSIEEKLDSFIKLAISEAAAKRDGILKELEEYKRLRLDEAENACLEKSYKIIQKGVSEARKKSDAIIALEPVENKKALLEYREELIDGLFKELIEKLNDFKKSGEYREFLIKNTQTAVEAVGDGELVILIDKSDEAYLRDLEKRFGFRVELSEGIIGGAVVKNITGRKVYDNSLNEKINTLREGFLEETGFSIY